MSNLPRPSQHLAAAAQRRRHVWREFEAFRAARGTGGLPHWPDWCYCPLAASYAVVSGGSDRPLSPAEASEISELGALAAWRPTQGIYRYDPTLLAELLAADLSGDIPTEVLHRLPEWCVYVELGGATDLRGFFAHLEWDAGDGREELRLLLDYEHRLLGIPIHLGGTVEEGLRRFGREAAAQHAMRSDTQVSSSLYDGVVQLADTVSGLVSLVLYLCSTEPDIDGESLRPVAVRGPRGVRHEPPPRPTVRETGHRIGAALRRARSQSTGAGTTPATHVRRAHWHTYWVGPRDNARRELRWISPTLVGGDVDDLVPTVHRVKEQQDDG